MKEEIHIWATRYENEKRQPIRPQDVGDEFHLIDPLRRVLNTIRNFREMKVAHDGSEVRTGAYGDKSIQAIEDLISVAENLKRNIRNETKEFSSDRLYLLDELLDMTDEKKEKEK